MNNYTYDLIDAETERMDRDDQEPRPLESGERYCSQCGLNPATTCGVCERCL